MTVNAFQKIDNYNEENGRALQTSRRYLYILFVIEFSLIEQKQLICLSLNLEIFSDSFHLEYKSVQPVLQQ